MTDMSFKANGKFDLGVFKKSDFKKSSLRETNWISSCNGHLQCHIGNSQSSSACFYEKSSIVVIILYILFVVKILLLFFFSLRL